MNKKWLLVMTSILLAAMVSVGCNVDPDPAPPEDNNGADENGANNNENGANNGNGANDNNANDIIEGEENIPGVDQNDTMNKDDENDAATDPEDPIEDAEDLGDQNNKDQ